MHEDMIVSRTTTMREQASEQIRCHQCFLNAMVCNRRRLFATQVLRHNQEQQTPHKLEYIVALALPRQVRSIVRGIVRVSFR